MKIHGLNASAMTLMPEAKENGTNCTKTERDQTPSTGNPIGERRYSSCPGHERDPDPLEDVHLTPDLKYLTQELICIPALCSPPFQPSRQSRMRQVGEFAIVRILPGGRVGHGLGARGGARVAQVGTGFRASTVEPQWRGHWQDLYA